MGFRNIFDYRNIAERKELNWFILFMIIFWILSGMFFALCCISIAAFGKDSIIPVLFFAFFIYAGIYFIVHGLPLVSLVKRRFNLIAPRKAGICWGIWLGIWVIQLTICISMFLRIAMGDITPLTILPLALISQICGFLVLCILVFLMIRQKTIC